MACGCPPAGGVKSLNERRELVCSTSKGPLKQCLLGKRCARSVQGPGSGQDGANALSQGLGFGFWRDA